MNYSTLPPDVKQRMDNAISVIALAAMRDQMNSYYGKTLDSSGRNDNESISREVLLGIHHMIELWVDRGYEQSLVAEVLRIVFAS